MSTKVGTFVFLMLAVSFCGAQDSHTPDLEYAKLRREFVESYRSSWIQDTTFKVGNHEFRVSINRRCTFDSAVTIPRKFIWEGTPTYFVTHNFVVDIFVLDKNNLIYKKTITKELFKNLLGCRELEYGVILTSSFYRFDEVDKLFEFHFSITIPVTDLGKRVELLVDLAGRESTRTCQ